MEFYRVKNGVITGSHETESLAMVNLENGEHVWFDGFTRTREHLGLGYRSMDFLAGFPPGIWESLEAGGVGKVGDPAPPPVGIFSLRALSNLVQEHDDALRAAKILGASVQPCWLLDPRVWKLEGGVLACRTDLIFLGEQMLHSGLSDSAVKASILKHAASDDMSSEDVLAKLGLVDMSVAHVLAGFSMDQRYFKGLYAG